MNSQSQIILAGIDDVTVFCDGWYGLEQSQEGIYYCATSNRSVLYLGRLNVPQGKVACSFLVSARPEHTGEPLHIIVGGGAGSSDEFYLETNHWTTRLVELEIDSTQQIQLEIKNPWSPDGLYQNGDTRALGVLLSACRISLIHDHS